MIEGIQQLHDLPANQLIVGVDVQHHTPLLAKIYDAQKLVSECSDALVIFYECRPCPQSWEFFDLGLQRVVGGVGRGVVSEEEAIVGVVLVFDRPKKLQVLVIPDEIPPGGDDADRQFLRMLADRVPLVQLIVLGLQH